MTAVETTDFGLRLGNLELIWAQNSQEFFFSNSLFLRGPNGIVFDPSANLTYMEHLAAAREVRFVVNTHYHLDHRALNGLFKEATYLCHRLDAPALRSLETLQSMMDTDTQSPYSIWAMSLAHSLHIEPMELGRQLEDGDCLSSGPDDVEIIHLPGHTPGHCGLYFKTARLLYLSDIDLTPYGPWYAGADSNIDDFKKSIQRVREFQSDGDYPLYYVSSHGERLFDRAEFLTKLDRFDSMIDQREKALLDRLKAVGGGEGLNLETLNTDCPVYRSSAKYNTLKSYFSFKMIKKHLELLETKGIVQKKEQGGQTLYRLV